MNLFKYVFFVFCLLNYSFIFGQNQQDSNAKNFENGHVILDQNKPDEADSIFHPDLDNSTDSGISSYKKEIAPQYPGGDKARIIFLQSNIKYPKKAIKKRIQGTVYVKFIVEKDGSLSNIGIVSGIGMGCDEEAIRVIKLMPNWIPCVHNGRPVRVLFSCPISFILQKKH